MKIVNSTVAMASQHDLVEKDVEQQSVRSWNNTGSNVPNQGAGVEELIKKAQKDLVEISEQAKELYSSQVQAAQGVSGDKNSYELSEGDKAKLRIIQAMLEAMTGKKVHFNILDEEDSQENSQVRKQNGSSGKTARRGSNENTTPMLGWGMEYHSYKAHSEQESTAFQAAGIVKTADGKEINFTATMNMSRQFLAEQRVDVKAGDALKDPLVINFDGGAAQLTENKFHFDIDSDGRQEEMSFLKQGSGFLAIDLDNNGAIDDGNELFGPKSGDGFADLGQYDSDGNQWIDENDPIYSKLRIWTKDADGKDQLFALGEKGIGAICLGNVNTEFSIKDTASQLQGQIRQTGIFLKEDGKVGTVQHVDLAI